MLLDDPEEHGWGKEGIVKWTELFFPDGVSRLLLLDNNNEMSENGEQMLR